VNPSGRLPITFPRSLDQLPRPEMPGAGKVWATILGPAVDLSKATGFDVPHDEGSDVGYRWFARRQQKALFPFGHGLSYTTFGYSNLQVQGGKTLTVSFTVTNTGVREGSDTPQVYLQARSGKAAQRLLGWSRAKLKPGESRRVSITADPRLLAEFDGVKGGWRIDPGRYDVAVGASAEVMSLNGSARISAQRLKP
jgi:beta-glucosidase